MVKCLMAVVVSVMWIGAGGCVSSDAPHQAASNGKSLCHAECLVCKYNADLACVDVAVDSNTPRCTCEGKTYYFCSDDCRHAFEKNPAKYLAHH
jgi:YHS domain-containing protein